MIEREREREEKIEEKGGWVSEGIRMKKQKGGSRGAGVEMEMEEGTRSESFVSQRDGS